MPIQWEYKTERTNELEQVLKAYGDSGWELVSAQAEAAPGNPGWMGFAHGDPPTYLLIFKRPIKLQKVG